MQNCFWRTREGFLRFSQLTIAYFVVCKQKNQLIRKSVQQIISSRNPQKGLEHLLCLVYKVFFVFVLFLSIWKKEVRLILLHDSFLGIIVFFYYRCFFLFSSMKNQPFVCVCVVDITKNSKHGDLESIRCISMADICVEWHIV